jgi:hypothetical protein
VSRNQPKERKTNQKKKKERQTKKKERKTNQKKKKKKVRTKKEKNLFFWADSAEPWESRESRVRS